MYPCSLVGGGLRQDKERSSRFESLEINPFSVDARSRRSHCRSSSPPLWLGPPLVARLAAAKSVSIYPKFPIFEIIPIVQFYSYI